MSKKRFSTDRQVSALRPEQGKKRTDYYHATEPGFICRVSMYRKTWMASHTVVDGGKSKRRKVSIGVYPDISLAKALEKTREIKSDARNKGVDIVGTRIDRKKSPTVADIMSHYFDETRMAPKTLSECTRISNKDIVPFLGHIIAIEISRQDIKNLHQHIADRGAAVAANRTLELLRRAYNCAEEEEYIPSNPFPNIRKIKVAESPRERVLKDSEIKVLWWAMEKEPPNMRDLLRLLLLLGQRSLETMTMRTNDIDIENREWTVPPDKTKTGKPNIIPLPDLAWKIIEPRLNNNDWLFPSKYNRTRSGAKGDGHTKSTKEVRRRLRESTGIKGWTAHDLRRTCRTLMSREGVHPHVAEQVLGHAQHGVENIYDQHLYLDEKRKALEKVNSAICRITGITRNTIKIIELRKSANDRMLLHR